MPTGITVGCLPILPRFFQQCSRRKAPSSSQIKASSTKGNDRSSLYWRSFACTHKLDRDSSGTEYFDPKPPHTSTMDFYGHISTVNGDDFSTVPKVLSPASSIKLPSRNMECFYEEEDEDETSQELRDIESYPACVGISRTLDTQHHIPSAGSRAATRIMRPLTL